MRPLTTDQFHQISHGDTKEPSIFDFPIWILVTKLLLRHPRDEAPLHESAPTPDWITVVSTLKDWAFVVVTALLLYFLLRR